MMMTPKYILPWIHEPMKQDLYIQLFIQQLYLMYKIVLLKVQLMNCLLLVPGQQEVEKLRGRV